MRANAPGRRRKCVTPRSTHLQPPLGYNKQVAKMCTHNRKLIVRASGQSDRLVLLTVPNAHGVVSLDGPKSGIFYPPYPSPCFIDGALFSLGG